MGTGFSGRRECTQEPCIHFQEAVPILLQSSKKHRSTLWTVFGSLSGDGGEMSEKSWASRRRWTRLEGA